MGEIDPNNLGPTVYKYDQVITKEDIEWLREMYVQYEKSFGELGDVTNGTKCCIAHKLMDGMLDWIEKGKPLEEKAP